MKTSMLNTPHIALDATLAAASTMKKIGRILAVAPLSAPCVDVDR